LKWIFLGETQGTNNICTVVLFFIVLLVIFQGKFYNILVQKNEILLLGFVNKNIILFYVELIQSYFIQ